MGVMHVTFHIGSW